MAKTWTDEEKKAFGAKMKAARAKKAAQTTEAVSEEKPKSFEEMTQDEKINHHYQHAQGSIQDIARVYKVTVEEVLDIIGLGDMTKIATRGDMIDQSEAGPEVVVNPQGKPVTQTFTVN